MKFVDFLILKENLKPSIDDNSVLTKLNELNIGGIGASPERQKLFKNISASEAEKQTLKEIQDMGINVFFQVTPDEKRTQFSYEK